MNRRLQQFLSAENISQAQFADIIGVARASVSHILAGRNKPGFDFLESMARHYPALNLEWLITGKGRMYSSLDNASKTMQEQTEQVLESSLFEEESSASCKTCDSQEGIIQQGIEPKEEPKQAETPLQRQRGIVRVVIFYDDNTYCELK